MNIFPPKDCSWKKKHCPIKYWFVIITLLGYNLAFSGNAQSLDDPSGSPHKIARLQARALKKIARRLTIELNANHQKTLQVAKENRWEVLRQQANGRLVALQGIDEHNNPIYYTTHAQISPAACTRTNSLYSGGSLGINLRGESSTVKDKLGIWDGGLVRKSHQELGDNRIKHIDSAPYINDHATHLAGILIGTGINKQARGMAFGANLRVWDFGDDIVEMAYAAKDLLISNHSYGVLAGWNFNPSRYGIIGLDDALKWEWWGDTTVAKTEDYKFGFYDKKSSEMDKIAYNAPYYLIVKSADNKRNENGPPVGTPYFIRNTTIKSTIPRSLNNSYDTVPMDANAKNILTVGAIQGGEVVPTKPSDIKMSEYSSWGPTDDGRIKPDIVGVGDGILSTSASSDDSYTLLSGTSVATPNISGSLLLLQEYYAKLNYGYNMRSCTLKALTLHSTNEAGTALGPDYQFGWGLLNIEKAAQVLVNKDQNHLLAENVIYQNSTNDIKVVASGKSPLVVTICWTDPEATPTEVKAENLNNRLPKLVNDLDLRILDGTTVFYPWVLNPDAPQQAATRADNNRDNVEQVYIQNPEVGKTYTIRVNHKGSTLKGTVQYYGFVVSGISSSNCKLNASISSAGNTSLCKGTVKLTTNSGTNLTYNWLWNGQQIPLANTLTYVPKVAGKYSVKITQGNCTAISPDIVVENAQIPVINITNGNNLCTTNVVNLSVSNVTDATTLTWYKNQKLIATNTATLNVTTAGSYTVSATQNTCTATSLAITVNEQTIPITLKPIAGKYLLITGKSTTIEALVTGNATYFYQWFKDGIAIENATKASLTVSQSGKYTVKISGGRCSEISSGIEFIGVPAARIAFEEDTEQIEKQGLRLFPNPTNSDLTVIYIPNTAIMSMPVEVINYAGISIITEKMEKQSEGQFIKVLKVSHLPAGIYFVRIHENESIMVKKFIKTQ